MKQLGVERQGVISSFGFLGNLPLKNLDVEGIALAEAMLQVALEPAGYKLIAFGKWHLVWAAK